SIECLSGRCRAAGRLTSTAKEIYMKGKSAFEQIAKLTIFTCVCAVTVWAQGANTTTGAPQAQSSSPATLAGVVDHDVSGIEKMVVELAEAMPEDKFNFSPQSLNIPGSSFKEVRTFAQQVKHIAASNFAIWSPLTGETFPKDYMGGNGPENLKTKVEIIQFLKDSFSLGH